MTAVDIDLLEALMVDFAAGEPGAVLAGQINAVCFSPPATLEACLGVLAATVKVANDSGVIPAAGHDAFYGLVRADNLPVDADPTQPYGEARLTGMRALTAALNNEWDAVNALLVTQLQDSRLFGMAMFHQLLLCWRSLVNTIEGALAVQLLPSYEPGTPCEAAGPNHPGNSNKLCRYEEPHNHGGFDCDITCPCRRNPANGTPQ